MARRKRINSKSSRNGKYTVRSAKTGRFVKSRSNPSVSARKIRDDFRAKGRTFSSSTEIIRRDRDAG